jgi:mRNA interferase RelE/StbE
LAVRVGSSGTPLRGSIRNMRTTVVYTPEALAGLRRRRNQAAAITAKIKRYAETGAGDVMVLTGRTGKRLRCDDYRVIFEENDTETRVLTIEPRGRVYE